MATGATTWGLGRVDATYAGQVISWSGIAACGAMAAGAPVGIWLEPSMRFSRLEQLLREYQP